MKNRQHEKSPVGNPPWGGKRKRAGRKPTGRKGYLLRMKPSAMRGIKSAARAAGQTVPEYLDATYAL